MRKLQLGTSLEGTSQITPTSPCHGHLLPEEEEEEDDDLGNGEEESCKLAVHSEWTYGNSIFSQENLGDSRCTFLEIVWIFMSKEMSLICIY